METMSESKPKGQDTVEWKVITTNDDLQIAMSIRKEVFVKEQGVPSENEFDQFDSLDGQCEHVLVYYNGQPVGTGRIRVVEGSGKLGRICVLAPYRQFGLGKAIVTALEKIAREKGATQVKLHGQTQAEGFYKKLGYQISSDVFLEEGIPHVLMVKPVRF